MSILRYDRSTRIVRIAPTREDLEDYINFLTLFDITRIKQGTEGLQGTHWYQFFSGDILIGTYSDITEAIEK